MPQRLCDRHRNFSAGYAELAELLAAQAASAATIAHARVTIEQLAYAKDSNRTIGVALGVLMARYKVTRNQAFDMLRTASQRNNRKLHDLAIDVVDTGELDPGWWA